MADRAHIRNRVLYDHLRGASVASESKSINELTEKLAYAIAISSFEQYGHEPLADENPQRTADASFESPALVSIGGLTKKDVITYLGSPVKLSSDAVDDLSRALDETLESISEFYYTNEDSEEDYLTQASLLQEQLELQRETLSGLRDELERGHQRTSTLLKEFDEMNVQLEGQLNKALVDLPPLVHAHQSASHDLLSLTIETSLLKLSLLRARAEAELYNHASTRRPDATMKRALANAHAQLMGEHVRVDEDERELDARLHEYEELLGLVDGSGHGPRDGFVQIVEDWARVQQETDECRRDLRRLGWTGD